MPTAPKQFRLGQSKQEMAKRPNSDKRGYGAAWQKYSQWRRRQPEEVICGMCERAATEMLDHVIAAKKPGAPEFMEPSNHVGMCWPCHRKKSVIADSRFGAAPTAEGLALVERLKIVAANRWAAIQATIGQYGGDGRPSIDMAPGGGVNP